MAREHGMIEPFVDSQVKDGAVSYGVSSYGYDVRISDEFKIFTNINTTVVDPKRFDEQAFQDFRVGYASAAVMILFVLILFITLVQFRLFDREAA